MTNTVKLFSVIDTDPAAGAATLAGNINSFIQAKIADGSMNFCIQTVDVAAQLTGTVAVFTLDPAIPPTIILTTPSPITIVSGTDAYIFTGQVDYYDPAVM